MGDVDTGLIEEPRRLVAFVHGHWRVTYEFVDGMKDMSPPLDIDLIPVTDSVFAGTGAGPAFSEG